jgi:hypothetical protein
LTSSVTVASAYDSTARYFASILIYWVLDNE